MNSKLPNGHWTLERCQEEAKKYKTKTEWVKTNGSAYQRARINGWLGECTSHMTSSQKPSGYWTLEKCQEEAKKFTTRKEWFKGSSSAYLAASRKGWLDACCAHMKRAHLTKEQCIESTKNFKTRQDWKQL